MTAIRAVIFDLDDTLYPERQFAFSGFDAAAAKFEHCLGDRVRAAARMRELFETDHRNRVFDTILAERGLLATPELVAAMVAEYRNHAPRIDLFPDADAALSRLRGAFQLGLITDGPARTQWAKIEALNLRERMDFILPTADLGEGFAKPHPRPFEETAERLGGRHTACVYVADNPGKDFLAPRRLGWLAIHVKRRGGVYESAVAPAGGEPDCVVTSLDGIESSFR